MPPKVQVGGEPFEPVDLTKDAAAPAKKQGRANMLLLAGALVALVAIAVGRRGRGK